MIRDHSITGGGVCGDGKGVSGIPAPDRESGVAGTVGRRFGALHGPGDGGDARFCLIGPIGASKLIGEMSNGEYRLKRRFSGAVDEDCWISENRTQFFGGSEGDDSAGYDFLVRTPSADWMFEVKSTLEDGCEFELTSNELRVASSASRTGRRRYRILYVPYVFSPEKWCVFELANPMDKETQAQFSVVGRGSLRLRFERR